MRRATVAGLAGSIIEFYDYVAYAFLVVFIGPLFFPADNPTLSVIASFGLLAVGYLARPAGALFFGTFGDRHGRRKALLVSIVAVGGATTVMGLLPTYAAIGVAAPILLLVTRLVQGFGSGGEQAGAATLVAESGDGRRHGFFQSFIASGANIGSALAPAVVGLCSVILGAETMTTWGWRVPLLISAVLTVFVVFLRWRVDETPDFTALEVKQQVASAPLRETFRSYWQRILALVTLMLIIVAPGAVLLSYMNVYLITVIGMPRTSVFWLSAIALTLGVIGNFLGGVLCDRFGARWVLVGALLAHAAVIYPVFRVIEAASADIVLVGLVYLVALICSNTASSPVFAIATRLFPVKYRLSGIGAGFSIAGALGGGLAPLASAALVGASGNIHAPAFLIIGFTVTGAVVAAILTSSANLQGREQRDADLERAASQ
ncbi:glycine betaine/L-proline transporter ProP [Pseudonocardia halophobica]|uniref:MFS transporter n=1 Tax=Pseudonocardia halophobica TaxID=29401 RepID=A0A9W6NVJ3_9PSEU|nr:MFS transporter [Pseudonocardia halophobica]GLL10601.1 MFS transporter [Pseudonocardia halophobica]